MGQIKLKHICVRKTNGGERFILVCNMNKDVLDYILCACILHYILVVWLFGSRDLLLFCNGKEFRTTWFLIERFVFQMSLCNEIQINSLWHVKMRLFSSISPLLKSFDFVVTFFIRISRQGSDEIGTPIHLWREILLQCTSDTDDVKKS